MEEKKKVGVGVGVMILKEDKVLLGRRSDDPEKADSELSGEGTWTMPGGKMEFDESFEEAAMRETAEETGIVLDKKKLKLISLNNDKTENAHFITIGFLYENPDGEPKVMEPEEIVEWKWFNLNGLPLKMFFPSAKIIKNYLDNIIYKENE
ncbi:MAG: NUDIX domain-containing protein [Candidatus Paceibacterota bacterium]|jgi:8-oxo-dGTP diphosphatase